MLRPIPELGTPGRSAARATRGMPIEPSACGDRCSLCDLGAWKLSFRSEVNAKYMQSILLLPAYLLTPNHRKNLERKPKATHLGPLAACRALAVDSFPMLPGSRRAWWFSSVCSKCLGFCWRKVSNSVSSRESMCGTDELGQHFNLVIRVFPAFALLATLRLHTPYFP